MKAKFLSLMVVLMSTWFGNDVCAQFYDDEDEIHFYVEIKGGVECFVCNFDGERATYFKTHSEHTGYYSVNNIRKYLAKDSNYFENKVYSVVYDLTYTDDYPSTSYIAVHQTSTGYTYKHLYTFSSDKSIMYKRYLNGSKRVQEFKKVPKEYFFLGRKRSNLNTETIYE